MTQPAYDTFQLEQDPVPVPPIDDPPYITWDKQDQAPIGESYLSDGSGSLFSMYLDRTILDDREMVEGWKGDADKILIFTGVFSATVAALLVVSVPNMQQDSQDISAFYLAHIYQQLNGSQPPIPSSLPNPIEPFTPPSSAVWVNGLWFLSLVISLTCALLATLVQQWARHYLRLAYPRNRDPDSLVDSTQKQARLRAFYRHGVEKMHIPWMMEAVPLLLHISLFLFFAGLSVFLFGIHHNIFKVVTAWITLCVILYACLTFLPHIRQNSPYSTPLSAPVFSSLTGIRYIFFLLLQRFPKINTSIFMPLFNRGPWGVHVRDYFSHSMSKTAEQFAIKLDPRIDYGSLLWTFNSLDKDKDLEDFFEGLPRLCDSKTGKELKLQEGFIQPNKEMLSSALIGLMNRTLSSNLVSEFVKQRRMIICAKAIESTSLVGPWWILRRVLFEDWYRFLGCIEFGFLMQNWKNITEETTSFLAQCVAAITVLMVPRDERWIQLACGLLVSSTRPKDLLSIYITHGDSILLAIAIFIAQRTIETYSGSAERHRNDILEASSRTLEAICKLADIGGTLPGLQHEFCDLWNQLVHTAKTDERLHHEVAAKKTLKNIRKLFNALHGSPITPLTTYDTVTEDLDRFLDNTEQHLLCTDKRHHPSSPRIQDLKFDEPPSEAEEYLPTADIMPMPIPTFPYPPNQPSPLTTPYPSSPLTPHPTVVTVPTLQLPSQYGALSVNTQLFPPASPVDGTIPFHEQPTYSHTLNVPRWGNVRSSSPAPAPPSPPLSGTSNSLGGNTPHI